MSVLTMKPAQENASVSGTQIEILVDATAIEDFEKLAVRQDVLNFARRLGFNANGLSTVPQPYPVDKEGKADPRMLTDPKNHPFDHWQAAYQVNAGLR